MKLNVGCGDKLIQGFINIDARSGPGITVGDVKKLQYPTGSVEELYASDILEHFDINEVWSVLAEWCRVLKPGGRIYIKSPDVEVIFEKYFQEAKRGEITWERLSKVIHGGQDYEGNYHYVCMSFPWLKEKLEECEMIKIEKIRNEAQNMEVVAYKK